MMRSGQIAKTQHIIICMFKKYIFKTDWGLLFVAPNVPNKEQN